VTLNSPTFKPALFIYFDGSFKKLDDKSVGSIGFIITNQGGDTLHKNKKVIENVDSSTESEYKSLEASLDTVLQNMVLIIDYLYLEMKKQLLIN